MDGLQCLLFLLCISSAPALEDSSSGLKPCEHQQRSAQAQHAYPGTRIHIPQCDEQGHFLPLQCHGSTGFCWCVDSNGHEVPGTQTPPGSTPPPCGLPESTQRPQTVCEQWRVNLREHYSGTPRDGRYVPQCDDLSHFTPLQCMGRVTSAEKRCRAPDPSQVPPLYVYPRLLHRSPAPPRPDVTPPSMGTFQLYAQGQQIGHLPLNGTRLQKDAAKTLLSLHVK